MEVIKLGGVEYSGSPFGTYSGKSHPIDGYSSMIWTERYTTAGEFQLTTPLIAETRDLLPEGSLISHTETGDVMIVETHSIERNADGVDELIITGRSFEVFLEGRGIKGLRNSSWKLPSHGTAQPYFPNEAAELLIWDALISTAISNPIMNNIPFLDPDEHLTGVVLTQNVVSVDDNIDRFVQPGDVYTQLLGFLDAGKLGIRCIRQGWTDINDADASAALVFFDSSGNITLADAGALDAHEIGNNMRFHVYDGRVLENVIFGYETGDLANTKYLFSIRGWANAAYVLSSTTAYDDITVYKDAAGDGFGIDSYRRTIIVDGGIDQVVDGVVMPGADYEAALRQKGATELATYNRIALFDAGISPQSSYRYGVDYNLGDTVTLAGNYGLSETCMVVEHVRAENASGAETFTPTLVRTDIPEGG